MKKNKILILICLFAFITSIKATANERERDTISDTECDAMELTCGGTGNKHLVLICGSMNEKMEQQDVWYELLCE